MPRLLLIRRSTKLIVLEKREKNISIIGHIIVGFDNVGIDRVTQ